MLFIWDRNDPDEGHGESVSFDLCVTLEGRNCILLFFFFSV